MAASLILGTAQLGLAYGVANRSGLPSTSAVDAVLDAAAGLGVRGLDTAAAYGSAEERIGDWLRRRGSRRGFEIHSKLAPLGPRPPAEELARLVEAAVEASLRKLGVERLSGYLIHHAEDLRRHGRVLVEALERQRERGRIGAIGVSVYGPEEASLALEHPELGIVQHPYNLLDRRLTESGLLGRLSGRGVEVQVRSAFLQGLLALRPDELPDRVAHARPYLARLTRLLSEWKRTPREVALGFASASGADRVVVGVETPRQLRDNLEAMERPLPAGLADALAGRIGLVPLEVIEPLRWPEERS